MTDPSTPPLASLYQELILEHYKRPRNRGALAAPTARVHMNNPTCGDEVVLDVMLKDGVIEDLKFRGYGCSISQASVSMMTQLLKGKRPADARALAGRFTALMHGDESAARDKSLGDLRALAGVCKYPARVKCALLGWDALAQAIAAAEGSENG